MRALEGLGEKEDPRSVDAMADALQDADQEVRYAAARSLKTAADPRTFDVLVRALKDPYHSVRNLSAQALGAIKDPRAVEPLIDLVANDTNGSVRFQAGRALTAITGQTYGDSSTAWRRWWEEQKKKKP